MAAGGRGRAEAVGWTRAADVGKAADVAGVFPGRLVEVAAVSCGLFPLVRGRQSIDDGRLGQN